MSAVLGFAGSEFRIAVRNRWVAIIIATMALFALVLSAAGSAPTGQLRADSLSVTVASLTSLAVYLVPLVALLMAFDAVAGEDEEVAHVAAAWCASRASDTASNDGDPLRWIGRDPDPVRLALVASENDENDGGSEAYHAVQASVRVGLDSGYAAALEAEREHLVRLRGTDVARASIEAFFGSTI